MVGQVPAMWNVLASDAVAHLCEFLPILGILSPATDKTYSGGGQRCKHCDATDHVLFLPPQHTTCIRHATGISLRRDRHSGCDG